MIEATLPAVDLGRWRAWFGVVPEPVLQTSHARWQELSERLRRLRAVLEVPGAEFASARQELDAAAQHLAYDRPYRVVVVGEAGAGKSTVLNALLRTDVLVTGAGGAVTGVATYVFPRSKEEQGKAKVVYRSEEQLAQVVKELLAPHPVPDGMAAIAAALENGTLAAPLDAGAATDQVLHDVTDIVRTWKRLAGKNLLGNRQVLEAARDRARLEGMVEEESPLNKQLDTRVVPAIAALEYYLQVDAGTGPSALEHVVFIDTPGLGARTLRHQQILREEVRRADAVVLVVSANRPEGDADKLANLLQQTLFRGYGREERDRFAAKAFFAVNWMDVIKDDDDRRRLDGSIQKIARVLSPGYLARYGRGSRDQRYFELRANLAVDSMAEGREASGIAGLERKILSFLGEQRLEMMLDEAESRLRHAVQQARQACRAMVAENGFSVDALDEVVAARKRFVREFAAEQLRCDLDELLEAWGGVEEQVYRWRESSEHETGLTQVAQALCAALDRAVRESVAGNMDPAAVEPIRGRTFNPVAGIYHDEVLPISLLLRVEADLQAALERDAELLARYYVERFARTVEAQRLLPAVEGKLYGQEYAGELDAMGELERQRTAMEHAVRAIFRSALLFELIQRPILPQAGRSESRAKAMSTARALTPGASEADAEFAGPFPLRARVVATTLGTPWSPGTSSGLGGTGATPHDAQAEEDRLVGEVQRTVASKDPRKVQDLVAGRFAVRYRYALASSLIFLEDLFFHEVHKFGATFGTIARRLRETHLAHVIVEEKAEADGISRILLDRQGDRLSAIDRAVEVLNVLKEFPPAP